MTPSVRLFLAGRVLLCLFGAATFSGAYGQTVPTDELNAPLATKRLGKVSFSISSKNERCAQLFRRGVAWLHAGDARQAERAFRASQQADPACAMAAWGLALATLERGDQDTALEVWTRAMALAGKASPRERMWIQSLECALDSSVPESAQRNYLVRGYDQLASQYPNDVEARAFLVRQLLDNEKMGMRLTLASGVDALIESILTAEPEHPAHRYWLQRRLNDQPVRALASAAMAMQSMPGAPLALVDAGQIHARLGHRDEAIACMEAAHSGMLQYAEEQCLSPLRMPGYVENADRLIRSYGSNDRLRDGIQLACSLIAMPAPNPVTTEPEDNRSTIQTHSSHAPVLKEVDTPHPTTIGQSALLDLILQHESWGDLQRAMDLGYLGSAPPLVQPRQAYVEGRAHFAKGDLPGLRQSIRRLRELGQVPPPALGSSERRAYGRLCRDALAELSELATASPRTADSQPTGNQHSQPGLPEPAPHSLRLWQPQPAPPFTLLDKNNRSATLSDYRGGAVVLVFYLGAGCAHCIEQLQSFAPRVAEYSAADTTILAVSTDSVSGLQATFDAVDAADAAPFRLLSDPSLDAFRAYGAFDAGTGEAMHGIFLIDRSGSLLWQNVSTGPFMGTTELLLEIRRLQNISPAPSRRHAIEAGAHPPTSASFPPVR